MRSVLAAMIVYFYFFLAGCSLKLPEIPDNHPAHTHAAPGQVYATPVVLEVRPFVETPDAPEAPSSRRPPVSDEHVQDAHDHIGHMEKSDERQPAEHHEHDGHGRHGMSAPMRHDAKSLQQMRQEGQRND
jgi:hypothetical protein